MKSHKGIRNQNNLDCLLSEFADTDIESTLVRLYLEKHEIGNIKNSFLRGLLDNSDENRELRNHIRRMSFHLDLKSIGRFFELLIPVKDRKVNGAFYTPDIIASSIVRKTVKSHSLVCDPSCGSGAFLVAAAERMHELGGERIASIIENNLFGCDILDYAIRRCKIVLSLLALQKNENPEEIEFNLVNEDSLELNWRRSFPTIFQHDDWEVNFNIANDTSGFDAVVGNPPHIRVQDIEQAKRDELLRRWSVISHGSFNIYYAFIELGMKLLKHDGVLGYVVPNNFFTSLAARKLRRWMQERRAIQEIIDFNHLQLFKDAITYTCIIILRNSAQENFSFKRIEGMQDIDRIDQIPHAIISYDEIKCRKWRLLNRDDFTNIQRIETLGTPLGKLAEIHVGIATLKDKLYFVDGRHSKDGYYLKQYQDDFLIEKEITRDIVKISSVRNEDDIRSNRLRIIFPYENQSNGMKAISEPDFQSKYPKCYSYMLAIRDELSTRDKGRKRYSAWYAYGREHSIDLYGPKILTPTFSKRPRFMVDWNKDALFCNGYGIFYKADRKRLMALKRILNSIVMEYYITRTSVQLEGGFPCFQKNFIEMFSVPSLTRADTKFLCSTDTKQETDEFLIDLYGLDDDVVKKTLEQGL